MALTKAEQKLLHEIDNKLVLLTERQDKQFETQDKIKMEVGRLKTTVYENGLNTRVKELHDWMLEQRRARDEISKLDDVQEHEIKLLGVRVTAEIKQAVTTGLITGGFALAGILLSK